MSEKPFGSLFQGRKSPKDSEPVAAAPVERPKPTPPARPRPANGPAANGPANNGAPASSVKAAPPVVDSSPTNVRTPAEVTTPANSSTDAAPISDKQKMPIAALVPVPKHEVSEAVDINAAMSGELLTAAGGPLQIPDETRNICALYDNGLFLVSKSHQNSPLVRSVVSLARRQNFRVNEPPQFVTPDIILKAYIQADRDRAAGRLDENAVRRRIAYVLNEGVSAGANDIHIETGNGRTLVQFRIDGGLRVWENWTQKEGERFLAAVWSHADVASGVSANWNEPLAATLSHGMGEEKIQLPESVGGVRCQWMPLVTGRYLNMRLNYDGGKMLGTSVETADVSTLGFNEEQTTLARHLRNIPGAMRMIAGPVNQGKTTTLRIMLNRRMVETEYRLNCLLVEDPPEGGVAGSRQIGVSSSTDDKVRERLLSEVMRASLRLDPDIVMLGEVRDFETATMAFRLALTGRQVYTTLHVYSGLAIPQRIRDLGIEPYLVYDHHLLRGLFAQRLSRTLCKHCKIPAVDALARFPEVRDSLRRWRAGAVMMNYFRTHGFDDKTTRKVLHEVDVSNIFFANVDGCEHCYQGRSGRTVLVEIVDADAQVMTLLSQHKMEDAKEYWLSPHGLAGISMLWHGVEKVAAGMLGPVDVEFELGPFSNAKELDEVENILGPLPL